MSGSEFAAIDQSTGARRRLAGRRLIPSWPLIVALAAFARALAQPLALLNDPDTYLHVAAGRWMLAHGALAGHDPFSFSMAGAHWLVPEWLAELLLGATFNAAGWQGVTLLTAACFAIGLAVLAYYLLRCLEPFSALIVVAFAAAVIEAHLLARPHLLAFPLLVIWCGALFAARDRGAGPPFRLLPLMTLWANLHASFLFGLALAGFLGFEAALLATAPGDRGREAGRWGGFLGAAILCAALTPNGIAGLIEPFRLMAMPALQASFSEWQSPNFQHFITLELWLLGLVALAFAAGVRPPASRLVLVLALIFETLQHVRHADLLVLVAPLALAPSLGAALSARIAAAPHSGVTRWVRRLTAPASPAAAGLALMLALAIAAPVMARPLTRRDDNVRTPSTALAIARRLGLHGHVFNAETFGGYLIFRGVPTFIDGRIGMYGNAFLARDVAAESGNRDALRALLQRYDIAWTLLPPQVGAVAVLDSLPGWRRIYTGRDAVIHVRIKAPSDPRRTSAFLHPGAG